MTKRFSYKNIKGLSVWDRTEGYLCLATRILWAPKGGLDGAFSQRWEVKMN